MSYIDAHVHVWTDDFERYPLVPGYDRANMKPPTFTPEEQFAHCKPCGVDRIVLIQMSFYGFDNSYMIDVMKEHQGVFSGVAVVDWTGERPDDDMLRLAAEGVRGFRIHPKGAPVESWLRSKGFERMFAAGADSGLAICPLIDPAALPELDRRCEEFPNTPVVIDHLCRIGAGKPIVEDDVAQLCSMARHENVRVKVSAFYALGEKKPPHEDLAPFIQRVYEAFGAERLMWASDCPYQVVDETYEDGIGLVRDRLDFLSDDDKDQVLRRTAEALFFA